MPASAEIYFIVVPDITPLCYLSFAILAQKVELKSFLSSSIFGGEALSIEKFSRRRGVAVFVALTDEYGVSDKMIFRADFDYLYVGD